MVAVAEQLEEKVQVNASEPTVEANIGTNITTLPGKELTLNCPSIGKPKPKVTWYKDAVELEPTSQIRLGEAGELVFKEVSYEDAARYTCVAENEYGRDKMSSILNVASKLFHMNVEFFPCKFAFLNAFRYDRCWLTTVSFFLPQLFLNS